jgi:7-keto-8-aminopelargonate synthetase-like enzyme
MSDIENKKQDFITKNTNKILSGLVVINLLLIAIALLFNFTITATLIIIMISCYLLISSDYGKLQIEKLQIYMDVRPYIKHAKSANHNTSLLGKYLLKLPIKEGETELDSYLDIKNAMEKEGIWPFMLNIKDTREEKITVQGKPMKCISSYNYLDLGRDESCQNAAVDAHNAYSTGNHGPRMLCGNLQILEDLEVKIAKFFKKEAALVFSSGFLACMSTISGLCKKGDLLLMDKLNHVSLRTGVKNCSANTQYFKHNNFNDAERIIKKHKFNRLIIVIEGIYSMDGDLGDLPSARKLCDKYGGILIIDEAHSLGTVGKTGRGLEELHNYEYKADIICGTFSKSISSVGGYLTCSKKLREYYCFYAPGVVFSAPCSAYHCGSAMRAFEVLDEEPWRVSKAQENGDYIRKKFVEHGFNIGVSETCVVPVIFCDLIQVGRIHRDLMHKFGFYSAAVMAPACPLNAPRFRICPTSTDTKETLDEIVNAFVQCRKDNPADPKITRICEILA